MKLNDFSLLKEELIKQGYQIGNKKTYTPIDPLDVSSDDIRKGKFSFENDGIYLIASTGVKHRGFMYKRSYRLSEYGKPRFHLCKCKTIQGFINSGTFNKEYRWANTNSVMVLDMNNSNHDVEISDLPFCANCQKILNEENKKRYHTCSDYINEIKAEAEMDSPEELNVDLFGYVQDWEEISKKYRESKDYTCEKCGIKVEGIDQRFMHAHHINLNKLNNSPDNLQCLCIKCHSEIDENHLIKLATGSNLLTLNNFKKKYCNNNITSNRAQDFPLDDI